MNICEECGGLTRVVARGAASVTHYCAECDVERAVPKDAAAVQEAEEEVGRGVSARCGHPLDAE